MNAHFGSRDFGWFAAAALAAAILSPCRLSCQTVCSVPPCINPAYNGAKAISGLVAGGATVTVTITANGKARTAKATAQGNGKVTIPLDVPLAVGDTLTFAATDANGAAKDAPGAATVAVQPLPEATTAKVVSVRVLDPSGNEVKIKPGDVAQEFALGNTLVVTLDHTELLKPGTDQNPTGLFLNGLFIDGVQAAPVANAPNALQFQLQYTEANRDAWSRLFGCKMSLSSRNCDFRVTVGLKDGTSMATESTDSLALEFLPNAWAKLWLGISLVLAAATLILAVRSSILRDSGTPRTDGKLGTYSLGRTQMALWFVTIVLAFLFIYAVTGVVPPITQGALVLMGIGAGTALGASAVDQSNQASASRAQLTSNMSSLQNQIQTLTTQIAAMQPNDPNLADLQAQLQTAKQNLDDVNPQLAPAPQMAASEGFVRDILTDVNGVSLHRLQIAAWTLVLWFLFMTSLFGKLTMMDFDATQLTLMAISGGTYLGFKLNEKQS
jgi:hypothetical protein